ncbi:hypothetical protein GCM10011577_16790 [Pseudarthrobacter polychromogenes]|uniref:Uncharacterized protein n=1 Tax=Pseudarthrobacter polychromogenes TaxID=1676 RepID=A0ABQ1XIK7_9MICC|nr:hypothetical protein GCM10011577_16790 [Pseudarthrobacter polychromogenes]
MVILAVAGSAAVTKTSSFLILYNVIENILGATAAGVKGPDANRKWTQARELRGSIRSPPAATGKRGRRPDSK